MRRAGLILGLALAGIVAHAFGQSSAMMSLPAPFMRSGDPNLMTATTTPKQYALVQPVNTTSYRGVNPCNVDIRIKTVPDMSTTVTATTGTRFLARTSETLGSTANPIPGSTRYVSIMTLADPGSTPCVFELGYGNGG